MSASAPLPKDHPLFVAWEAYKDRPEYANTKKWVGIPQHTEGSLWAAFMAGWVAAKGISELDLQRPDDGQLSGTGRSYEDMLP